ncbi:MAG: class I SAM-dependent RNA methyltransferase, partial [Clostridia bacterium]|nr:class I SAM-dependent RNA methyltransferase [Clostridia bacterium]
MKFQLVATCLFGLEHLLGEEIDALGYERVSTIDGRVTFLGDPEAVALSNIFLRYAERVFIKLGSFEANTFDELFEGTRALPWPDFIGRDDEFPVKGHSIQSNLTSSPDCQRIVKKAVVRS